MEKKPYHHKNLKNDLIEKGIELVKIGRASCRERV